MKIDGAILTSDLRDAGRLAAHAEELCYDGLWTAEAGHDPVPAPGHAAPRPTHQARNACRAFPRSPLVHGRSLGPRPLAGKLNTRLGRR